METIVSCDDCGQSYSADDTIKAMDKWIADNTPALIGPTKVEEPVPPAAPAVTICDFTPARSHYACAQCNTYGEVSTVAVSCELKAAYDARRKSSKAAVPYIWLCRSCYSSPAIVDHAGANGWSHRLVLTQLGRSLVEMNLKMQLVTLKSDLKLIAAAAKAKKS
jgi:hypothetical protein